MTDSGPVGIFLPWDTEFYGLRIGRLNIHTLNDDALNRVNKWAAQEDLACCYFLSRSDDPDTVETAVQAGFRFTGVKVTLVHRLTAELDEPANDINIIRPAVQSDLEKLRPIAMDSFTDSRFYTDGRFPLEKCSELYRIWLERSLLERYADLVLTGLVNGEAAGFIIGRFDQEVSRGIIDLIGIGPQARGQGLGRQLVGAADRWFRSQGATHSSVVTQGRNYAAQSLYQSCGYRTSLLEFWFHRWFDEK